MQRRRLSELQPGETGVIHAYEREESGITRLLEMGLLPGTLVRLLRRAPLGDPLELEVRGCQVALRKADATCIVLEPA